ncbi:MAG: GlsB/YeaQ/YmgE family stress response membrane protein [Sandaracinaceae bacterium]
MDVAQGPPRALCATVLREEEAMTLLDFLILIVIAGIAGAIGRSLSGFRGGGVVLAIVMGFIGAYVGYWLASELGLPALLPVTIGGVTFPFVWAIVGAALLVLLVGLFAGRSGGLRWGVSPPTRPVLTISVVLALLALVIFLDVLTLPLPFSTTGLLAAAYIALLLGNLVKGL